MKFSHEFKEALHREGFPEHWVNSAIPYGQLKKLIKRVAGELSHLGLDPQTLNGLIASNTASSEDLQKRRGSGDAPIAFQYNFAEDADNVVPKLTLYVHLEDGIAVDATLSPDTRKYLERLVAQQPSFLQDRDSKAGHDAQSQNPFLFQQQAPSQVFTSVIQADHLIQRIEVPLTFDAEFFDSLQGDVSSLDALQADEQRTLSNEVRELGQQVAKVARPTRASKTDLRRWQELFDLYLQAGIFFSTNELDHGSRNSAVALKQLQWFQAEAMSRGIAKSFKLAASREVLGKFLSINLTLLNNLKFQEMNQMAVAKILKKFDKRTALGAKKTFPKLIRSHMLMSETMAKSICAEVSNEIVKIVPQLDDYLCPVCFSISYKPVRLTCNHVFCIRCMIQMQKQRAKYCPLCRNDVIMHADSANLDKSLMDFLKTYFPKETKAKQKENEIAAGVDLYGEDYANAKCVVM